MNKQNKKYLYAFLSFIFFPFGIYLFFTHKPKKEAQLFILLSLLGLIGLGFIIR